MGLVSGGSFANGGRVYRRHVRGSARDSALRMGVLCHTETFVGGSSGAGFLRAVGLGRAETVPNLFLVL